MISLSCPSCGGSIEGVSPHIRSIDCQYCGSWLRLNNQLWQASTGKKVALNAPSFLRIGMQGSLPDGIRYKITGRIRLQYENDSWDEWWLEDNQGNGFWLEEDDGVYYRHTNPQQIKLHNTNSAVGKRLTVNKDITLFITEKFEATIVGREGFLPTEPETSASITYLDGVCNGVEYSLEMEGNKAHLSQAEIFDINAIRWENQ